MRKAFFQKFDVPFYREALSLALPIALQNLLTSCGTLIDTAMVVGLGNAETSAVGVAARFTFLLNIICFGISSGCAALLSQYWGAKDIDNTHLFTVFCGEKSDLYYLTERGEQMSVCAKLGL